MQLLLGEILDRNRRTHPTSVAVTLAEESLTFADVDDAANQLANALASIGVGHGDNVAWWSEMTLREVAGFFALARLGATFAPLNPRFSADEARPVLEYVHPRVLVVDQAHALAAAELCSELDIALAVFGADGAAVPGRDLDELASASQRVFSATPQLDEGDPHAIFLTSGSTGAPKGVVLSHRTSWLRATWMTHAQMLPDGRVGEGVCMFPLFHWAGWQNLLQSWQSHVPVHYCHGAQPELLLGTVARRRATVLYCIPGIWRRIFASGDLHRFDVRSLRQVNTGTSAVSMELLSELKSRFPGTTTGIGYGSTEGGAGAHLHDADLFTKPGSVGRPNPFQHMRLTDDGEICVRSTALADGYFERPEATAETFIDDWYHTGDRGSFDEDGYLWIIGRTRELIRSGAEWIAPVEVEEALRGIPGIKDLAVVGLPDDQWGELVSAVLVLDEGVACPRPEDLRRHLTGLASYKHPRHVVALDAIPRTPATGQVRRAFLREHLVERLGDA